MKLQTRSLCTLLLTGFLASCNAGGDDATAPAKSSQTITHYNIVLVPDLSNRLEHATGLPDAEVIRAVVGNIPKIARHKRFINQQDRFSVLLTSQQLGTLYGVDFSKLRIDLGRFPTQRDRIDYLSGGSSGQTLQTDTGAFLAEFQRMETQARQERPIGADLWSLFHNGIGRNQLPAPVRRHTGGSYQDTFRNILVVLTDGYIEAGVYGTAGCDGNRCRYLSKDRINAFRRAFQHRADTAEAMDAFFHRNGYGIVTAGNAALSGFEVLLVQAEDRSLTPAGSATVYPTDLEILTLFWRDWMEKSGVRHFDLRPLARDRHDCEKSILAFLGIS